MEKPVKACPKHPGHDSMVPCLGCGRDFCRLCDPPKGAGQYCPECYRKSLSNLAGKTTDVSPPARSIRTLKERARRERPEKAPPEKRVDAAALAGSASEKVRGSARRVGEAFSSAGRKVKSGALRAVKAPPAAAVAAGRTAWDRFPLTLTGRERQEGMVPVAPNWYKVLAFIAGGTVVWTVVVALTHRRYWWLSLAVAVVVSWGLVWALGGRSGPQTAVAVCCLTVLSLALGELLVMLLLRFEVIKTLDIPDISMYSIGRTRGMFHKFFRPMLLYRMLPSAAVAFLIGLWPLPKRPSWRGFARRFDERRDVDAGLAVEGE